MKISLSFSSQNLGSKVIWLLMALSLIGLADASYLTVSHYLGNEVACSVIKGCEVVLTSKYATVFGMPVAAAGVAYYAALFLLVYYFRMTQDERFFQGFLAAVAIGIIATACLVYLQLGVIGAICQYCMLSAIVTTIIVLVTISALRNKKQQQN
jgi:uncharacterized membrane protein